MNEMNETGAAFYGTQAVKVRNWNDSTAEQKLDALRDHIEWLAHRLADAEATIYKLRFHQHSPSGEIVIYLRATEDKIEPHQLRMPTNLRIG